jgi:hypothetical protein
MEIQCDKCGILMLDLDPICVDCHEEIFREEEQRRRLVEENYDFEYGDYKC